MKNIKISVVICTMNRHHDLLSCLNSIEKQTVKPYELIVVDASKDDCSEKIIAEWNYKVHIETIYIRTVPGLTRQRNVGIKRSKGNIIGFLDDDVILEASYLERMADCFSHFPFVVGTTGYITNNPPKKKIKRMYQRFFFLSGSGRKGKMLRSGFAAFHDPKYVSIMTPTEVLSGCNMFFRRDILDKYHFDEAFEGYSQMEDVEFSHRISKKNPMLFVKGAKLIHNRSKIERLNLKRFFEMSVFNHYYIFKKNVKKSCVDWLFFLWSDLGHGLNCLRWTIKEKNGLAAKGFLLGHIKIYRDIAK